MGKGRYKFQFSQAKVQQDKGTSRRSTENQVLRQKAKIMIKEKEPTAQRGREGRWIRAGILGGIFAGCSICLIITHSQPQPSTSPNLKNSTPQSTPAPAKKRTPKQSIA
jgi:hypothetical protein